MRETSQPMVTAVADLTGLKTIRELQDCPVEQFGPMLDALEVKVNTPGASIAGYNGAGGLARDERVALNSLAE